LKHFRDWARPHSHGSRDDAWALSRTRIGEAIARRISGDTRDPEVEAHLEALEDELTRLRGQLGETQGRREP
jgi:hypothetical protein